MKLLFLPEKALISRQNALKTIHQSGSIWIRWSCLQHSPHPELNVGVEKKKLEMGMKGGTWKRREGGRVGVSGLQLTTHLWARSYGPACQTNLTRCGSPYLSQALINVAATCSAVFAVQQCRNTIILE